MQERASSTSTASSARPTSGSRTSSATRRRSIRSGASRQLKALLVGKAVWVRNNVTGQAFYVRYDTDGRAVVLHAGKRAQLPSEFADLVQSSYQTVPSPYSIQNGKLITALGNTSFEVTVYKMGDKYCGARSNE